MTFASKACSIFLPHSFNCSNQEPSTQPYPFSPFINISMPELAVHDPAQWSKHRPQAWCFKVPTPKRCAAQGSPGDPSMVLRLESSGPCGVYEPFSFSNLDFPSLSYRFFSHRFVVLCQFWELLYIIILVESRARERPTREPTKERGAEKATAWSSSSLSARPQTAQSKPGPPPLPFRPSANTSQHGSSPTVRP